MGVSLHFFSFIHKACRLQLGNMTLDAYFIITLICITVCKMEQLRTFLVPCDDIHPTLCVNALTLCWHHHLISSLRMVGEPIRSDKTFEESLPLWPDLKVLVFSVPLWFGMDKDILSAFPPEERLQYWGGSGRCLQHINERISQFLWRWFPIGHHWYPQPKSKGHSCWFCPPPPFHFYVFIIEK